MKSFHLKTILDEIQPLTLPPSSHLLRNERMKKQTLKSTKAVAYVRASKVDQEISPLMQRERIEAYCRMSGLELVDVIQESVSAKFKLSKRPEGAKVRKLLDDGVAHVVALKLDRLFRNAADALTTVEEWNEAGISLHIVDMGGMSLNTASSMGKMLLTMLAGFAEFERNVISERTSQALQHKKALGQKLGKLPYGFDADDAGMLVVNRAEQKILDQMKALRKQGFGYHSVALRLNGAGIVAKQGGKWHPYTVQGALGEADRGV
jgi:DNA invertase Pin-like site-specific DNA recombinase